MNRYQPLQLLFFVFATLFLVSEAWAEGNMVQATDQSFSVKLPATFRQDPNPPSQAILATVIPNSGVSLYCSKQAAEEVGADVFAEQAKRNLYDNGAQIYGKAKATLDNKPAASFLVGGIKEGKESLFVYNTREDALYVFVLNYPKGQRKMAAGLWNEIAPTFHFAPAKKKKKG